MKIIPITNVSIYPLSSNGKLKAVVKIVLNDCFILTNLRVYYGSNGLFVSYPIEFTQSGEEFRQIFYPLCKEMREYVETEVLKEYHRSLEKKD